MFRIIVVLVLVADASVAMGGVTEDLQQIEQQLAATWKKGDCDGWARLVAPEWSVTHITGEVMTRARVLQMCRGSENPIAESTVDQVSVRPYGAMAVVTGRTTAKTGGASPVTVTLRFTDVFIRRAGRWQVVASQATRLSR
jgi:hypothetical protein